MAQVLLHGDTRNDRSLQILVVETHGVVALCLGLIHGNICPFHQFIDVLAVITEKGRADAHRGAVLMPGEVVGLFELAEKSFADLLGFGGRGFCVCVEAFQQDHKLVAPETGHGVGCAHLGHQALCHLHQQLVADIVAKRVVQRLEVVQIEEQQCSPLAAAGAGSQGVF